MKNHRNAERFDDFARVYCEELCIVSGILTDISNTGFKADFNAPCSVDKEKEYEIQLRLSRVQEEPLLLLACPMWSKFQDGKTSIGFSILHSKDTARLEKYIKMLKKDKAEENETGVVSFDSDSLFI